jgi:hypothetical protein
MVTSIRFTAWLGIGLNLVAIFYGNTTLVLIGQFIAAISGALWAVFIQNKLSIDIVISTLLGFIACITQEPFWLYSSMLVRSISYQLVFERTVRMRREKI